MSSGSILGNLFCVVLSRFQKIRDTIRWIYPSRLKATFSQPPAAGAGIFDLSLSLLSVFLLLVCHLSVRMSTVGRSFGMNHPDPRAVANKTTKMGDDELDVASIGRTYFQESKELTR